MSTIAQVMEARALLKTKTYVTKCMVIYQNYFCKVINVR